MDAFGHVNNVAFVGYLEDARVDLLFVHAGTQAARDSLAAGIVVARHEIDYCAPLTFRPAPVVVEVWVSRLGASSFTLSYEVKDETTYARARSVMVPVDPANGRPRRLSEPERAALDAFVEPSD